MNTNYYTYKFYDEQGRRLAVKGEIFNNRVLFTILTCSKQDQFSKKFAKNALDGMFGGQLVSLTKLSIPVVDNKPAKTFINYLNENYCRLGTSIREYEINVLLKNRKFIKTIGNIKAKSIKW